MLLGKLTIFASGNKAIIDNVDRQRVRIFGDFVRNKISSNDSENSTQTTSSTSNNTESQGDIVSKLERLAKLKEQSILTEEEFVQQKKKFLGQ